MISKAAYMMQEHMRRGYSYLTNMQSDNVFMVRGRLPFPQGLSAIAVLFRRACPADVYAHAYFIERQSNPSQPSMQNHLTEELQGIIKVVSGLRYMKDDYSKLDNTMLVVTDDAVAAAGRMLCLTTEQPPCTPQGSHPTHTAAAAEEEEEKEVPQAAYTLGVDMQHDAAPVSRKMSGRADLMSFCYRRMQATGMVKQMNESNIFSSRIVNVQPRAARAAKEAAVRPTSSETREAPISSFHIPGRTLFPSPEESSSAATVNAAYFRAMYDLCNAEALKDEASTGRRQIAQSYTFPLTRGHYTVLYNPIEVNEQTFGALLQRLHKERRVVRAIVVPTRQTWQHAQLWADVFPDAEIISSGPIPIASDGAHSTNTSTSTSSNTASTSYGGEGGMQVMENGLCGLAFPDFDDDVSEETRKADTTPGTNTSTSDVREAAEDARYADPADVLWYEPSLLDGRDGRFVGLRASDADRVRVLQTDTHKTTSRTTSEEDENDVGVECVRLTPNIELHRIAGDAVADEYVLYDRTSQTLACTDLFHGEYGDFDPLSTWVCRVWFKFMRKGNYKRVDLVPRFKWLQVRRQHGLPQLRHCVDRLTRRRAIRALVFAHGSPPCVAHAANALRQQWGMTALTEDELPGEQTVTTTTATIAAVSSRDDAEDKRSVSQPITTQG